MAIHYQQVGHGPDVVMIHGLLSNLAFWYLGVVPLISAEYRVTVYDLRGHGLSSMPRTGYTSAQLAADLRSLLDHLRIERAHLIGHSFGGAIALHLAVMEPQRARSLVEVDAHVPALERGWRANGSKEATIVRTRLRRRGLVLPRGTPLVLLAAFEEHLPPSSPSPPSETRSGVMTPRSARKSLALLQTTSVLSDVRRCDGLTVPALQKVSQPTLAVFGERTWCVGTLRGLAAHLPDCRRAIVSGEGHAFPIVKPEALARELMTFIGKDAA